jgi:alpha-1,3-rhamnosyl/mannosyltransferase
MKVLVNDRLLFRPLTGAGYYLANVVTHWPREARVELVGYHSQCVLGLDSIPALPARPTRLDELRPVKLRPLAELVPPTPSWFSHLWAWTRPARDRLYHQRMRWEYQWGDYRAFFEPNCLPMSYLPPTVTTIHDVSVLEYPQLHPQERVAAWEKNVQRALRWTDHWVCYSEATASGLHRVLGVAPESIAVIPLASRWGQPTDDWPLAALRARLGLPERYLVCLGTIEPRKNIHRLLDAFATRSPAWRRRTPLVLVGMAGWGDREYWRSLREHPMAAHVFFTGYLNDAQAAGTVRGAAALLYPSIYEGFGMPPLEAMTLGVPVAASTAASVREVCAGAATLIDAADTEGWGEAMEALAEPGPLRDRRIHQGRRQAAQYSWRTTARRHHDLLEQLGNSVASATRRNRPALSASLQETALTGSY